MLCQYLAVFGRDDEDAICSGQKLKGGRAGVAGGAVRRKGRDGADRSIEFNMRGEIEEERQRERRRMSCQQDDSARLAPFFGSVHAAFARVLVVSQIGPCIIHVIHAAMNALISSPSCIAARSRFASNLHRLSCRTSDHHRQFVTLSA